MDFAEDYSDYETRVDLYKIFAVPDSFYEAARNLYNDIAYEYPDYYEYEYAPKKYNTMFENIPNINLKQSSELSLNESDDDSQVDSNNSKSFVERRPYLFAALLSFPIAPLCLLGYRFYRNWKYEEELTWKMGLLLGFAGLTNFLTGPMLFGFTVAHHGWKNWAPFGKPWLGKTAAVIVAIIGIALTTLSILGALAATGVIAVGTTLYAIGAAASHIPVISQLGNLIGKGLGAFCSSLGNLFNFSANQVVAEVVVTTAASNTTQASILVAKTTTGTIIKTCCCSDESENVPKKYDRSIIWTLDK
ncbi:MAG: hypothetical protein GY821_15770 [Gammaproteobacteria bacterium]|nr:hypothetical protein [Gammaproteobacteria bacterium]